MVRSMSVAVRESLPPETSINTFERMGMVFRRSTTLCTWASDFSRAARSMVSFMAFPIGFLIVLKVLAFGPA